jgi:hypothetical protein
MPFAAEYLDIDGVSLHRDAWWISDLSPLWGSPDVRGADKVIPGASGVRPKKRRANVTQVVLELVVVGEYDRFDAPTAIDPTEQLEANVAYLRANVMDPTNVGDGTRLATHHLPSGATRSGPVHVIDFEPASRALTEMTFALGLSIPGGALA